MSIQFPIGRNIDVVGDIYQTEQIISIINGLINLLQSKSYIKKSKYLVTECHMLKLQDIVLQYFKFE